MENSDVFLGLQDFLERMRQPTAADFVKSIKSFIVSFSNNAPDPERDSAAVQAFFANMEAAFRAHPLWAGCSEEELDSAGEGLEKYVMTKLFTRVFASLPDDVKQDEQLSEKMALVQQFVRPENLDIKPTFQNETAWLLAQKELQKINMYKAPRDKLVCVLNCCKVINNLLLNASIASNENPPGADDFLPVLIYVTIKANPPQLHSNLSYIQRYRRQSRLVSEAAYFFTNMLSAEAFISNIDAKALSMEETEFEKNMEFAQALLSGLSTDLDGLSSQINQIAGQDQREPTESRHHTLKEDHAIRPKSSEGKRTSKEDRSSITKIPSISELENRGATILLKEDHTRKVFREYPYMFAHAGDLTINDVEGLLNNYKQLVFKYVCLLKGSYGASAAFPLSRLQAQRQQHVETVEKSQDNGEIVQNIVSQKDTDREDDGPNGISDQETTKSHLPKEEAAASSEHNHVDTSEQ
ncbi:Vacuolar protein sorting-associated protein 9A [Hibiscus syriacus]|uniref:Vacuolar protein sorting-associated protein 9A n=1 Tax=Hibiscus syriacus TaxID=106335 RepID=A0A6A3AB37_HIBSY|nr:vacuolar protein sorting-associated protein 9A-like [Hibiscus syriacus]XP_039003405.1 vacuolar protein sorting-associated protein 9A-like [Hibiscus syriacus]KAE8701684.1 Vacuolar protein sorting-associated protein 9A [Hibiscus syriacus]